MWVVTGTDEAGVERRGAAPSTTSALHNRFALARHRRLARRCRVPRGERMRRARGLLFYRRLRQPAARGARGRGRAVGARADGGRADPLQPARPGRAARGRARRRRSAPASGAQLARTLRTRVIVALPIVVINVLASREGLTVFARLGDLGPVRAGRPDGGGARLRRGDRAEGDAADADHDARRASRSIPTSCCGGSAGCRSARR